MFLNSKDDEEVKEILQPRLQHKKHISDDDNKPLSPVLSSISRRRCNLKKDTVKSRVKLTERYKESDRSSPDPIHPLNNDDFTLSQTENLVSHLEQLEEIERQRKVIYDILINNKNTDFSFKKPLPPRRNIGSKKQNGLCTKLNNTSEKLNINEVSSISTETISEYKNCAIGLGSTSACSENTHFYTAGGKNLKPSETAIKKYCKLFDDILTPNQDCNTHNNKYNFLSKKSNVSLKEVQNLITDNFIPNENISVKDKDDFETVSQTCISLTQEICDSGISNTQILFAANKILEEEKKSHKDVDNLSCLGFTKLEIEDSKIYHQYFNNGHLNISDKINYFKAKQNECLSPPIKKIKLEISDNVLATGKHIFDKLDNNIFSERLKAFSEAAHHNKRQKLIEINFSSAASCSRESNKNKLKYFDEMIGHNDFNIYNAPVPTLTSVSIGKRDTSTNFINVSNVKQNTSSNLALHGFASASGKEIKISDANAKKAESVFKNVYDCKEKMCKKQQSPSSTYDTKINKLKSNRLQEINKNKLNLFDKLIECNNLNILNTPQVPFFNSMENESGRTTVNADIAQRKPVVDNLPKTEECSSKNFGFSSASGKNVKISDVAANKASAIFKDLIDVTHEHFDNRPVPNLAINTSDWKLNQNKNKEVTSESNTASKLRGNFRKMLNLGRFKSPVFTLNSDSSIESNIEQNKIEESSKSGITLKNVNMESCDSTPVKLQNTSINHSKRKLGMSFCKQISISDTKLKRARLIFDEDLIGISPIKPTYNSPQTSTTLDSVCHNYSSTPVKNCVTAYQSAEEFTSTSSCPAKPHINDHISEGTFYSPIVLNSPTKGTATEWIKILGTECQELEEYLKILHLRHQTLTEIVEPSYQIDRKPRSGFLYHKKTSEQKIPLSALGKIGQNTTTSFLNNISPQNAENVHFTGQSNIILTKDEAKVIPNFKNLVGLSEIEFAFKHMPGVEPSLMPKNWIRNHFKWIIWKLASYERMFPDYFDQCFSVENVMLQLKYRYDREIDKAERSALRKIYEKDDVPQKRMILCVSNIEEVNGYYEIELTDGWYSIKTNIDDLLCKQIYNGKLNIGTKLIIFGAELYNCDGCHPLEATDLIYLKINYNSTRRAKWHARLGYQNFPGPFPIPIHTIHPNGGLIGSVKICIIRTYPLKYLEKIDGRTIWRNKKAEERRAQFWENERCRKIEQIQEQLQQQFASLKKENNSIGTRDKNANISEISCPEQLLDILENSNDPDSIEQRLTSQQKTSIMEYKTKEQMEMQQELAAKVKDKIETLKMSRRDVRSTLKLLVIDLIGQPNRVFNFFIWQSNESHLQILREGMFFLVENVLPQKNGDLSSSTKTIFRPLPTRTQIADIYKRKVTEIENLNINSSFKEFDTIGIVVAITIGENHQDIWLTGLLGRLLLIEIHEGPDTCLLLDNVKRGQAISVCNLIYKHFGENVACALANHSTVFSIYPQFKHLQEGLDCFTNQLPKNMSELLEGCDKTIELYKMRFCKNISDVSDNEDDTLISSRLSTTDVALSLIDIENLK